MRITNEQPVDGAAEERRKIRKRAMCSANNMQLKMHLVCKIVNKKYFLKYLVLDQTLVSKLKTYVKTDTNFYKI